MHRRRWLAALTVLGALVTRASAASADTTTTPYPGVTHVLHDGGGQRYHLVTLDLLRPALRLHVSAEKHRGKTVSAIAKAEGAVLAVNGQIFRTDFSLCGIAMARGVPWTKVDDTSCSYSMGWGTDPKSWMSFLGAGLGKGPFPAGVTEITGGYPWLVKGGVLCDGTHTEVCTIPSGASASFRGPNPRTFLGVDEKRTKAFLVVVDGRELGAASGMTLVQAATFMRTTVGAHDAVNVDGGGSSELWIGSEGGVVNEPSDGSERVVADAILLEVLPTAGDAGPGDAAATDGSTVDTGTDDAANDDAAPIDTGTTGEGDTGAPTPAPSSSTTPAPASTSTCGCHAIGHVSRGGAWAAMLACMFALARRRRRS